MNCYIVAADTLYGPEAHLAFRLAAACWRGPAAVRSSYAPPAVTTTSDAPSLPRVAEAKDAAERLVVELGL